MTAAAREPAGPLRWMRTVGAKYLGRRPAPPPALPPGPDEAPEDFGDAVREKAREVVSGIATLTHRLALTELSNEALRDENRALRERLSETGRDLADWAVIARRHGVWNLADELGVRAKEIEAAELRRAGAAEAKGEGE